MKVFWSWQSDTPGKTGRHFVRDALNVAIEQLKQTPEVEEPVEREIRSAMHLDHDRKGVSGNPDLVPLILEKIEQSAVFVADVTLVGLVINEDNTPTKKLLNSNVAIELGYALHSLTDRAILMVMNEYYGSRADLPFDLQLKAGHILFTLPPEADRPTIAAAFKQLTVQFTEALKPFIGQRVESIRQERPFLRAGEKDGPTKFRTRSEPLGIRDGAGMIDSGAGNEISCAPGAAVSLRLFPQIELDKKWTSAELQRALNRGINLPTLLGPANGLHVIRAEDGVGTCIIYPPEESKTDYVTFVFKSGEIWAISTYPLKTHPSELFVDEIEKILCEELPIYAKFLRQLGVQPPYQWLAALDGVKARELQYPVAPGRFRIPGFESHKCVSDSIVAEGLYDAEQSATNALLPFFDEIYDKCGIARPTHLAR
jgi:hypothetical protein